MRLNFFLFLLLISAFSFAQRIINFNLYPVNNTVVIKFTVSAGASCNGYTILHSVDSINYTPIENYPGICGGSGSNEDYSFTNTGPVLNQTNYYKIQLFPFETSPPKRIFLSETTQANMYVYPNPVLNTNDIFTLKFLNVSNLRVVGFLYNQFGTPLRELDLTTQADLARLDVNGLGNGMYVLWLTDGNQAYSAKFVINRR